MSQFDGGISVDEGYREAVAGRSGGSTSAVSARADRASPGSWDEDLGRWGSDPWNLPGFGESGPGCGEWYPEAVCTEHGHVDMTTHSCGRRSCPECWGIWAKEAAVRATQRLQSYRYTQPDDYRRQVAHAILSPPEGTIRNEREFWEGRAEAAEIAERKGFRGCLVIPHPWRVTEAGKQEYRADDPDYGIWVWLRNDVEDMEAYIYWSPHYHVVGPTSADMDPAEDGDTWVYKFERAVTAFEGVRDRESHQDLYGLCRYLLSHTGFPEGSRKQVVTWYGQLANSVFVEDAAAEWQVPKPSEGVRSALRREIEAVADVDLEDDEDGAADDETDDMGECPVEDCDGVLIDVWDIRAYLDHNDVRRKVADRMVAAREWRLGERYPPPGLKSPRTEEAAHEAFEALL